MKHKYFEDYFQSHYGFIILNKASIHMIKKFTNSILEIGAGTGLWAKLLQNNNIEVIATDLMDEVYTKFYKKSWTDVEKMDCVEAVKKYRDVESLMLIWPNPQNMSSFIEAIKEFKGNKVIIVNLYKEIDKMLNREWELVESKPLTLFPAEFHLALTKPKKIEKYDSPLLHLLKRKL